LVIIPAGYEALLRARRRRARGWDEATRTAYRRHRWRVEGVHGEAKTQHGLRRAVRRGLANVAIQVYLTAAAMNLKRLARQHAVVHAAIIRFGRRIVRLWGSLGRRYQETACRGGDETTLLPQAA